VLEQLDYDKRTVFVLYELEELTLREIAEALEIPLQTAYSRLRAARQFVRDTFALTEKFDPLEARNER
jgi:RNA polymerase sigma-70 factor, ECF subfamily